MYGETLLSSEIILATILLGYLLYLIAILFLSKKLVYSNLKEIDGKWWAVAAVPPKGSRPSRCTRLNFTLSPGNLHLEMNAISSISGKPSTFIADITTDYMIGPWKLLNPFITMGSWKHTFLTIEKSCAVLIIYDSDNNNSAEVCSNLHAVILSREKSLDRYKLEEMKKKLGAYVDREKIVDVEQNIITP